MRGAALALLLLLPLAVPAPAQEPLQIDITEGVAEPLPIALPDVIDLGGAAALAGPLRDLIAADLAGSGLFREIPRAALLARPAGVDMPVDWADWRVVNAAALLLASARVQDGRLTVAVRVHDVIAGRPAGTGLQFDLAAADWRRAAHKIADLALARLTGEGPMFDSRIAFVAESGPAESRVKQIALADSDGAGRLDLTDGSALALAPRQMRDGSALVYTALGRGGARLMRLALDPLRATALPVPAGAQPLGAAPSADGRWLALVLSRDGNTDLWLMDAATGAGRPLTAGPEIDTAPSFSPGGDEIVFESDRSGTPQLYVLTVKGGAVRRLSPPDAGRHGAPAWSPTGELIAFAAGDAIGVMRPDGSGRRLLTEGFLDGAPTFSPNGRMIAFARRDPDGGRPRLAVVDAFGGTVREIGLDTAASDPDWGPVLP